MTTDWKALCAELVDKLDELNCSFNIPNQSALIERTRAALARPEPEGPTDEAVEAAADVIYGSMRFDRIDRTVPWVERGNSFAQDEARRCARAVLVRYARPTIQPVPVAERLPGPEDCDEEGRCWWGFESSDDYGWCWALKKMHGVPFDSTHWRPHHALPLPPTG
jgi:hypothetical protein